MFDFSITLAPHPKYWKIGPASVVSDDLDDTYYVASYTFWLLFIGFTLTITVNKQ